MIVPEPADLVRAPRAQAGSSPQHLLATVLGEYLDSAEADLPSTAIIAILAEFGISESSARAALSRLTRRGLIAKRGTGRPPVYHLSARTIASHHSVSQHFLNFGARPPQWTGDWVMASFSLPGAGQASRHAVRKTLTGLRFVGLYDSVWIRPGCDSGPARKALTELLHDVEGARWSIMHVRFDEEAGPHGPAAAYDLSGLAAAYSAFIRQYADLRVAARNGTVDAARALVARATVMDSWRRFPEIDPDLPEHLLPAPWPRQQARETFLDIHSALGSLARKRLIEVATPHWPDAAAWITYFQAGPSPDQPPARH
jgi:phenylacetic acid degradation operon negative regulatory protein